MAPTKLRRTVATSVACLALLAACTGTRPQDIVVGAPPIEPGVVPSASSSDPSATGTGGGGTTRGPGAGSGGTGETGPTTTTSGGSSTGGTSGSSTGLGSTGDTSSTTGSSTSTSGTTTGTSGTTTSSTTTGSTSGTSTGSTSGSTTSSGTSTSGSSTAGSSTSGSSTSGSTTTGSSTSGSSTGEEPPPEADLYNDEEKYTGITEDRVHFCGHAALIFAEAFDTRPQDLNVYWSAVNEAGGVYGREVTMNWYDDGYDGPKAVQAAQSCKAENPFMLLGGIGFDQIPGVRIWAEQNRMLYLHHIAVAPDQPYQYSFSGQPTVEDTGSAFGEYITSTYGGSKVGIIWRESENWEPGHRVGREVMEAYGVDIVSDLGVQKNQGVFTQEIYALQGSGAEVVWVWENALGAAEIIKQANAQGYHPTWVVFPFQTTLDLVKEGDGSFHESIDGVATWPAYARGGYGGAYSEFEYDEEIARFEAAYAKYRPNIKTNDILWQVWIGNKALHDLLIRCGEDCNRNRIAGMFLSGLQTQVNPNCMSDYAHEDSFGGHIGGHLFTTHRAFVSDSGPWYETTRWCSPDLF